MKVLTDDELVRLSRQGCHGSFGILVQRYEQVLLRLSLRYVHDLFAAEDVVQESLLKAYQKLSTFEFRSAFKSWLYRITINTAKNSLRSQKPTVPIDDVDLNIQCETLNTLIDKQLITQARNCIDSLPEKQKEAVKLRVFSDLSFKEVADEMDCPYDTAKANYRHGLLKLQEKMVITW